MKSYEYEAIVYDGEIYCCGCQPASINIEQDIDVSPIFANSEWDYMPVCSHCGYVHDYMTILNDDDPVLETLNRQWIRGNNLSIGEGGDQ